MLIWPKKAEHKHKNLLSLKMSKEILTFSNIEINKNKFWWMITRFLLVKENYKYFVGYWYNDHKVKPLHLLFPKTSAYVKR